MNTKIKKFIYGAGKYGILLLKCLKEYTQIDYFVQTEESELKELEGIPVITLKKMCKMDGKKLVFIAINNRKVAIEIERNILIADPLNTHVYYGGSFISDNLLTLNGTSLSESKSCLFCGNKFAKFLPGGNNSEIFQKYHIIGGGYRESCLCPYCGSGDRNRWFLYCLLKKLDISHFSGTILHLAPEKLVESILKENKNIDYYTGDIVPERAMHVTDITNIQYQDSTFDWVISNHVMEHIVDEKKAVSEIKRVLKTNGKWIFSFPICTDIKTYEDKTIDSAEARLREYGQEDHVRLYGYDYIERFQQYGFNLSIYSPERELDDEQIEYYGFIKDDIIIEATKKDC